MFTVKAERGLRRPCTDAMRRFGKYKREQGKAQKEVQVQDRVMEQLRKAWKDFDCDNMEEFDIGKAYSLVKDIGYGSADVTKFCMILDGFQKEKNFAYKAGLFLSALMNNCVDEEFTLPLSHLDEKVHYIGFDNSKRILIEGDVGCILGNYMKAGEIIVMGSVENETGGNMEGGRIIIQGDSGATLGSEMKGGEIVLEGDVIKDLFQINMKLPIGVGLDMKGGEITVKGDASSGVGEKMTGGEIHLEGTYESISEKFHGGEIYHKGELVAIG
jgi:hypothetical protein